MIVANSGGREKPQESLPGRASLPHEELTLMCVNMNGLRKKRKRILLGKLMYDLWAGICVVTETHFRKPDLDQLAYDNYHILADYCRPVPLGERIGGGVVILAHNSLSVEVGRKLEELRGKAVLE